MSWKPVLLTKNNRPPQVVATIKDDMLKLQIAPEIAGLIGIKINQPFSAFVGTAGEHGQVKIVSVQDGMGKVKGGTTTPTVYVPAERSWQTIDEATKCDFEIVEDEKTLIVNLPWYTGTSPDVLHGNQKLTMPNAARMIEQFRRGVPRRRLAELYTISEQTVVNYTNSSDDIRAHNAAVRARKAEAEAPVVVLPPVTMCPPRAASGLRKGR
jgi:hypothetical protein